MRELKRSLSADLKQISWTLFLIYLILAVIGYLFGRHAGYRDVYMVCLGIAALVTVAFACLYLLNLIGLQPSGSRISGIMEAHRRMGYGILQLISLMVYFR